MKKYGFNSVRLIIFAEWWIDDSSTNLEDQNTNRSFQFCMKETIRIAQEYGIYIIIAPWGIDQGGQSPIGWESGTSIPNAAAFASFWGDVAAETTQYPNVLYELWNEPAPYAAGVSDATWWSGVQGAVNAIRAVSDNIIVVQLGYCGGFDWVPEQASDWGNAAGNILYSNHIYRYPSGATLSTSEYTYAVIKNKLLNTWGYDAVINTATNLPIYPLWIGEVGAWASYSESGQHETSYWTNVLQLLNDWQLGYAAWNWDQPGSGWDLQTDSGTAPYLPNQRGQILISATGGTYP
jgi:hypothetical protein